MFNWSTIVLIRTTIPSNGKEKVNHAVDVYDTATFNHHCYEYENEIQSVAKCRRVLWPPLVDTRKGNDFNYVDPFRKKKTMFIWINHVELFALIRVRIFQLRRRTSFFSSNRFLICQFSGLLRSLFGSSTTKLIPLRWLNTLGTNQSFR